LVKVLVMARPAVRTLCMVGIYIFATMNDD